MIIVGLMDTQEETMELQHIAKIVLVGNRIKCIARRVQNDM